MAVQREGKVGLLLSGGLDSAVVLGLFLAQGKGVCPIYIQSHLAWQQAELAWLGKLLRAMAADGLDDLVVLEVPLADLYADHWAVTGTGTPLAGTADDAVYLPGRNLLLAVKAALWCQLHGLDELALGVLGSNPFTDATPRFFQTFEDVLQLATGSALRISRPLAQLHKRQVMQLGRGLPLELTFSCIAPVGELHCGQCNKCQERQEAFAAVELRDPTHYARPPISNP